MEARSLPAEPQPDAEEPFVDALSPGVADAIQDHERPRIHVPAVWPLEMRGVGHVGALGAELQGHPFADLEFAENPHVKVEETRPAHAVGAAGAEASARRLRERAGVDPQAVTAGLGIARLADVVGDLGGTCGIEIAGIRLDRERRARIRAH